MKRKNSGFTIVELLTVVVIISILVGLLIPGIAMVRNMAKTTEQKAQFTAIELGVEAFKSDYGQYPESKTNDNYTSDDYQGVQKLAEAMVGRDMLGFHPNTDWGEDGTDYEYYYRGLLSDFNPDSTNQRGPNNESDKENYDIRKDLYLELKSSNIIRLGSNSSSKITGLLNSSELGSNLDEDSLVICDVYKHNNVITYLPDGKTKMTKYGNPILYYRANTASKDSSAPAYENRLYDYRDNEELVDVITKVMKNKYDPTDEALDDSFSGGTGGADIENFYTFISDPKLVDASNSPFKYWPHNSDSYILISAGHDGLYGTEDDICNFNK